MVSVAKRGSTALPANLVGIAGVCELTVHQPAAPRGWLLIEVPHGATSKAEYDAVASTMKSRLPAQLEHFFFVNTDIGAPEGAQWLGRSLSAQGFGVVIARCLFPRTFIDPNRVVAQMTQGLSQAGLTAAIPSYITDPDDFARLNVLHERYTEFVTRLYSIICGDLKGLALQLHSYAPRSVGIEKTDEKIVEALHAAYQPEQYAKWPERPPVDLICALQDGSFKAAPALVAKVLSAYRAAGIDAKENGTYHLHPVAMGFTHAKQYPEQVVCVELNRGLVADPFTPFGVSPISAAKVEQLVAPLGAVLAEALAGRGS